MKGLINRLFKSKEGLKPLKKPQKELWSPIDYNLLFNSDQYDGQSISKVRVGELRINSNKVIASDPFLISHMKPFTLRIENGNFPVDVIFIELETAGRRIGLVKLTLSEHKAIKWQLAVTESDDTNKLEDEAYIGYPVNAGLGCFVDSEFAKEFDKIMDAHYKVNGNDSNYYDDVLASEFKANALDQNDKDDIGDFANHFPNKERLNNVVIFSSGIGDGSYPSYWGLTDQNEVCELVTDFLIIDPIDGNS